MLLVLLCNSINSTTQCSKYESPPTCNYFLFTVFLIILLVTFLYLLQEQITGLLIYLSTKESKKFINTRKRKSFWQKLTQNNFIEDDL